MYLFISYKNIIYSIFTKMIKTIKYNNNNVFSHFISSAF